MNCYLCSNTASYSCTCELPNLLICSDHLIIHKADKNNNHTLNTIEDLSKINLFKEIENKLIEIRKKIILNSKNQIQKIEDETKQSLAFFNRIKHKLDEKYLKKSLNNNFLEEAIKTCRNKIDLQIILKFQYYLKNDQLANDEIIKKIKKVKYSNGDIYKGEYNIPIKEHWGFYNEDFNKESIYEEELKFGLKEGNGIYMLANGDCFEGEFKNNKKEGKGVYKWASGDIYEGDYINGQKEGRGVYKYLSEGLYKGDIYEGEFKNNMFHGIGTYKFASGIIYEGEFNNGIIKGKGVYRQASGNIYKADMKKIYYEDKMQCHIM